MVRDLSRMKYDKNTKNKPSTATRFLRRQAYYKKGKSFFIHAMKAHGGVEI
jgi:hypothetical protein